LVRRGFPRIFFGWWTALAGGFLCFWGYGYYMLGFSALFKPIALELGLSRAVTSVAASIGRFEGGFEAVVTGWVTDKFGPRWIILCGTFLIGLGLILMSLINSLWAFYVVWGVIIATGVNVGLSLPLDKAISNWFVKKRGMALSVRWVFTGLGSVIVLPLITWLIGAEGWRITCVIGGTVMWLVGLPLAWFFVRPERPEHYGLLPDGATIKGAVEEDTGLVIGRGIEYAAEVEEIEFTLRQAMKTRAYWLLILAYAGHSLVMPAIMIHTIPFLTDMGLSPAQAAALVATASAASIPTRFIGGVLADRVRKEHQRFVLAGTFFVIAAGITAFLVNQTIAMAYVFFFIFYLGFTTGLPLNSAIRARYFGRKGFGSIQGTSTMIMTPFGVAAPIYAGWVYDVTGKYATAFAVFAGLLAFSTVVMLFARPPRPPIQVTDIRKFL